MHPPGLGLTIGFLFFFLFFPPTKARSWPQSTQRKKVITEVLLLLLFPARNCRIPFLYLVFSLGQGGRKSKNSPVLAKGCINYF